MIERKLILAQLDQKLIKFKELNNLVIPPSGWIYAIRTALNMSLKQLGKRMNRTAQSVREIEEREKKGTVSINVLRNVAMALDMKFVYGFIPKKITLEKMIEERAYEIAQAIVERTAVSMSLEDQKPSDARIKNAIKEKAEKIITNMPKYLWD